MVLSEIETLGSKLMDKVDKLTDHVPNVKIINYFLPRLGLCTTNFGFTLFLLFCFTQSVQEAVRDLCTSAFCHAATYNFVYFHIVNRMHYLVTSCFRHVLVGAHARSWCQHFGFLSLPRASPFTNVTFLARDDGLPVFPFAPQQSGSHLPWWHPLPRQPLPRKLHLRTAHQPLLRPLPQQLCDLLR